jgi:hypothetical protein
MVNAGEIFDHPPLPLLVNRIEQQFDCRFSSFSSFGSEEQEEEEEEYTLGDH